MNKKRIGIKSWILLFFLAVVVVIYSLVSFVVVPKAASFTTPHKWRMIPLRQTKEIVHGYLGQPLPTNSGGPDTWVAGSKGKMYFLRIYYVKDTIASGFSIHYVFKNRFMSKDYLLDSMSIR